MLELIGRYRIHEQIGEGAMADVYRAHDPHIDRALAIKVLKAAYREDREYAARFLREARAAGALSHPGIVTVYDVGEVDGFPFIVMELLEGEPLSDVLKRGAIPPSRVIEVGIQLVDALAYAHSQGVIHRDIKPSNIVLSPNGRTLKLLDFGIAHVTERDPLFEEESYRTQIGQVIGTPRYMSPEQTLGQAMDVRSDVYSVGIVLYEMLTGRRVFSGTNAAALAAQIVNTEPAQLAKVVPDTPRGLQFIVHKAIAKQPAQRFSDAQRMADALRREYSVAETVAREAVQQKSYLPLQVRLTILLALITTLVLAAAVGTTLVKQRAAMRQVAVTSGVAVSAFVANNAALRAVDNAALPPEQQDWVPVQAFVKNASADPNLRGLTVVDARGVVRAATNPDLVNAPYRAPAGDRDVTSRDGVVVSAAEDGRSFRFVRPILYADRSFGKVDLLLDQATLTSAARLSTWLLVLLALVTLASVALSTFLSARVLQAPIKRLRWALLELARGNLDFRISHSRRDEFGELFDDVNLVAQTTQERLNAMEAMVLDHAAPVPADRSKTDDAGAASSPSALLTGSDQHQSAAKEEEISPADNVPATNELSDGPFAPAAAMDPKPSPLSTEAPDPSAARHVDDQTTARGEAGVDGTESAHDAATEKPSDIANLDQSSAAETRDPPTSSEEETSEPRTMLSPPWPHDEDEDRTLVDPQDGPYR